MNEITIVTAFFDIGRGNFSNLNRSNNKYIEYFKFWARMQNNLIIYSTREFAKEIENIRDGFGLKNQTRVIIIDDIYSIEPEIFKRMKEVSSNPNFRNSRFFPGALSNEAKYDYVMMLKYWCMNNAVSNNYAKGSLAWVDFGMCHGGKVYSNTEEFNFLWQTHFDVNHIHLFSLTDPDNITMIDTLQSLGDCITGYLFIIPDFLCNKLWELIKNSMNALIMLDYIDDDQMLLCMAYRAQPEIFDIHICDWFMALKVSGGEHLSLIENGYKKLSIKQRISLLKGKIKTELQYIQFAKSFRQKIKHSRNIKWISK